MGHLYDTMPVAYLSSVVELEIATSAILALMCRQPFAKPRGWLAWGLLGILLSPVVIGITVTIVSYAGYEVRETIPACTCCIAS